MNAADRRVRDASHRRADDSQDLEHHVLAEQRGTGLEDPEDLDVFVVADAGVGSRIGEPGRAPDPLARLERHPGPLGGLGLRHPLPRTSQRARRRDLREVGRGLDQLLHGGAEAQEVLEQLEAFRRRWIVGVVETRRGQVLGRGLLRGRHARTLPTGDRVRL